MKNLRFRNTIQVALWECEISGQISDGLWENARPMNHWIPWCDADVTVAESDDSVGRDFYARKDNYDFNSSKLVNVVGDRMILYARLALARFAIDDIQLLGSCFRDWDGEYTGPPSYDGSYYDRVRDCVEQIGEDQIREAVASNQDFDRRALRRELKDMKTIVRTRFNR